MFGSIELCRLARGSRIIVVVENDVRGLVLKEEGKKVRKVLVLRKGFVVGLAGFWWGQLWRWEVLCYNGVDETLVASKSVN